MNYLLQSPNANYTNYSGEDCRLFLWTTNDKASLGFRAREDRASAAVGGQPTLISLHEMVLWESLTLRQSPLDA